MDVIGCAPNSDRDDIRQRIEGLIPEKRVKVYKTFEGLSVKLHRPTDPKTIVVIVASNREKLSEVSPLRRILGDFRTIVVTPDQEPATAVLAHQLRPRFLTFASSHFGDLATVLQKMIEIVETELRGTKPSFDLTRSSRRSTMRAMPKGDLVKKERCF